MIVGEKLPRVEGGPPERSSIREYRHRFLAELHRGATFTEAVEICAIHRNRWYRTGDSVLRDANWDKVHRECWEQFQREDQDDPYAHYRHQMIAELHDTDDFLAASFACRKYRDTLPETTDQEWRSIEAECMVQARQGGCPIIH